MAARRGPPYGPSHRHSGDRGHRCPFAGGAVTDRFVVLAGLVGALLLGACSDDSERDPQVLRAGQLDIRLPPGWKVTDGGVVRPASAAKAGGASPASASSGPGDTVRRAADDAATAVLTR